MKYIWVILLVLSILLCIGCEQSNNVAPHHVTPQEIDAAYSKDLYRTEDTVHPFRGYYISIDEVGARFLGTDVYFGKIETAEQAATIAERIWIRMYGEEIVVQRPYIVEYAKDEDIWFVHSDRPPYKEYRLVCCIRGSDGKLLSINYDVPDGFDTSRWIEYPVQPDESGIIMDYVMDFSAKAFSDDYGPYYNNGPLFTVDSKGNVISNNKNAKHYGNIDTAIEAAIAVEKEITRIHGQETAAYQRPYKVYYDASLKIWMVVGSSEVKNSDVVFAGGGWATAMITAEKGEILFCWIAE